MDHAKAGNDSWTYVPPVPLEPEPLQGQSLQPAKAKSKKKKKHQKAPKKSTTVIDATNYNVHVTEGNNEGSLELWFAVFPKRSRVQWLIETQPNSRVYEATDVTEEKGSHNFYYTFKDIPFWKTTTTTRNKGVDGKQKTKISVTEKMQSPLNKETVDGLHKAMVAYHRNQSVTSSTDGSDDGGA